MVDVTLSRKLTEKSKFGFGKYSDLKVREVLNMNHPNYIRWCYFNADKISFIDNILDEVKIPEDYRIEKPGKDPELGKKLEKKIFGRVSALDTLIFERVTKKRKRASLVAKVKRDIVAYSRSAMQGINQGHRY